MKQLSIIFLFTIALISCAEDEPELLVMETATVSNLHAPQSGGQGQPISGAFTKFNFATGQATTSDTDWDIAFRGTTIIINGGISSGTTDEPDRFGKGAAYVANGTMATIITVDEASLKMDTATALAIPAGSDNGWYNYSGAPKFAITPLAGKIIVVKTHNGTNYAKLEILSYYKDSPENPDGTVNDGRYFSFNYVYQPNEGVKTF